MKYLVVVASTSALRLRRRDADGALIPADPQNSDYRAVLAWVAAGNVVAAEPDGFSAPASDA